MKHRIFVGLALVAAFASGASRAEFYAYQIDADGAVPYSWHYSVGLSKKNALCSAALMGYGHLSGPKMFDGHRNHTPSLVEARECEAAPPAWIMSAPLIAACNKPGWFALYSMEHGNANRSGGACGHPTRKGALESARKSCIAKGGCDGTPGGLAITSGFDSGKVNPKQLTETANAQEVVSYPGDKVRICISTHGKCAGYMNNKEGFRVVEWEMTDVLPPFLLEPDK